MLTNKRLLGSHLKLKSLQAIVLTLAPLAFLIIGFEPAIAEEGNSTLPLEIAVEPTNSIVETPIVEVQPTALTVLNPSFEEDLVGDDSAIDFITGWQVLSSSIWSVGVYRPSSGSYASQVPDGVNVAFSNGGSLFQRLTDVLTANLQYTLSVDVGSRPPYGFPGYQIDLLAGETIIATDNASVPEFGQFITSQLTYSASETDPLLGQPLALRLSSKGVQVNFDDVRLTSLLLTPSVAVNPVVEPVAVEEARAEEAIETPEYGTETTEGRGIERAIAAELQAQSNLIAELAPETAAEFEVEFAIEPDLSAEATSVETGVFAETDLTRSRQVVALADTNRRSTSSTSVPEPTSVIGLLIGVIGFTQLKRKHRC